VQAARATSPACWRRDAHKARDGAARGGARAAARARAHEAARARASTAPLARPTLVLDETKATTTVATRDRLVLARGRRLGRGELRRDPRVHLRRSPRAISVGVAALRTGPSSALGVRALDDADVLLPRTPGRIAADRSVGGLARRWGPGARPGAISAAARPTARRTPRRDADWRTGAAALAQRIVEPPR
jgi:hypothetical protein